MGVTIEIYRSRIGSHHNFMEGHKSNFQGQFWNEMLLKFYISLLLPRNIKFRFHTICKENAQYPDNVYNIGQLLKLSNDVEENPGPTILVILWSLWIALTQFMLVLTMVTIYSDRMLENIVWQCN